MRASWPIARISDLDPGEFLEARCSCGSIRRWRPPDLPPGVKVDDMLYVIEMRLRCIACRGKGEGRVKLHVLDGQR